MRDTSFPGTSVADVGGMTFELVLRPDNADLSGALT